MLDSSPIAHALGNGESVCSEGYIMDNFCIDMGTLFDNPGVDTLRNPEKHSVHCLVDVDPCYQSGYAVLGDPASGQELYTVTFALDSNGTAILRALAQSVGSTNSAAFCESCTGKMGDVYTGMRAGILGTVVDASADPPIISVGSAKYIKAGEVFCSTQAAPSMPSGAAPAPQPTSGAASWLGAGWMAVAVAALLLRGIVL
jgi:hypothetical protein